MYVRRQSKETTKMATLLCKRFLLYIRERECPEASGKVQRQEKKKQTGRGQCYQEVREQGARWVWASCWVVGEQLPGMGSL